MPGLSRRAIDQHSGAFQFHIHVGKHPLNALETTNGLTELFSLLNKLEGKFEGSFGDAQCDRRGTNALTVVRQH